MTQHPVRLGFQKLNVPDMDRALVFWREAFGFTPVMSFDEPDFIERILALPGQEGGPNLLLVQFKDGRDVGCGPGHGPLGLMCQDIDAAHRQAVGSGATSLTGVFEAGGAKVAMLHSPDGHEIELVQLPA